jgi:galactofuranosylgalactofuranosylrhamnosyl-N-acetylglucosaminyl-diphospho-decaprenol beta-1,5/1,6-galactofuranosyltransferase
VIRAIEDFLRGPEVLADGGGETVGVVRKLWSEYQDSARHAANAVPGIPSAGMPQATPDGRPSMPRAVLAKRILQQLMKKPSGTVTVSSADAHWWHVSLFETAVVTDASQESVRVRRFDRQLLTSLARRSAAVLWRLNREGERARAEWQQQLPRLSSRETWSRLFDCR